MWTNVTGKMTLQVLHCTNKAPRKARSITSTYEEDVDSQNLQAENDQSSSKCFSRGLGCLFMALTTLERNTTPYRSLRARRARKESVSKKRGVPGSVWGGVLSSPITSFDWLFWGFQDVMKHQETRGNKRNGERKNDNTTKAATILWRFLMAIFV